MQLYKTDEKCFHTNTHDAFYLKHTCILYFQSFKLMKMFATLHLNPYINLVILTKNYVKQYYLFIEIKISIWPPFLKYYTEKVLRNLCPRL